MSLSACKNGNELAPKEYDEYNQTMEKYFLAMVEKDLFTMKQYLSQPIIDQNPSIKNAEENDTPKRSDYKENMGDKYSIKGFDYFYDEFGEIYYSIEYYNFKRERNDSLVFGVRKENNGLKVFNAYGLGGIGGSHVKEVNDGGYFTLSSIKEAMRKYPEHTFTVKKYPGD
jgi:hypothetical protein